MHAGQEQLQFMRLEIAYQKSDANINGSSIKGVGSYKPNPFGLYDIHGNVWEWCEDWYANYPAGVGKDPKGPAKGERRVLRGGSFLNNELCARSSLRSNNTPTLRYYCVGFRLAKTP
jgi:formylglycine-generating enzyme required for sulfatase activity